MRTTTFLIKMSSFLRWVFFPFIFQQKIFFYSYSYTSHPSNPDILTLSRRAGTTQACSAGGWAAGCTGHPETEPGSGTRCLSFTCQALAANSSSATCQTADEARWGQSWWPPASSPSILPALILPTLSHSFSNSQSLLFSVLWTRKKGFLSEFLAKFAAIQSPNGASSSHKAIRKEKKSENLSPCRFLFKFWPLFTTFIYFSEPSGSCYLCFVMSC